jgi:hypothetical protein
MSTRPQPTVALDGHPADRQRLDKSAERKWLTYGWTLISVLSAIALLLFWALGGLVFEGYDGPAHHPAFPAGCTTKESPYPLSTLMGFSVLVGFAALIFAIAYLLRYRRRSTLVAWMLAALVLVLTIDLWLAANYWIALENGMFCS